MKILIMNGINLCMLGTREPAKYGNRTLDTILDDVKKWAAEKDIEIDTFVTNFEGEFVEKLYAARGVYDGVVMNCGAWSHYSIGIRDAVAGCGLPAVDVHITNVYAREEFRHKQVIAPVCVGQISGFGESVYKYGVQALAEYLSK
jgi:3-dehydroquinate dehydratase-2